MKKKRLNSYYQRKFRKALWQMAIWSFGASLVWTGLSIYNAWNKEEGIQVDKKILNPVSIKFDVDTLKKLEKRQALPTNFQPTLESSSSGQD